MGTLVAGVGYRNLRDLSFGPLVIDRLRALSWPQGVEIEDLSYGPISAVHRFQERPAVRMVLIGATRRNRVPGRLYRFRPGPLPPAEEVQQRVGEALTGVISLDNLWMICRAFAVLPDDVEILEVEPADEGWGEGLTPDVERAADRAVEWVRHTVAQEPGPLLDLRRRDEVLQVLFWLRGEGIGEAVRPTEITGFLDIPERDVCRLLDQMVEDGLLLDHDGKFRLTESGLSEGRSRFVEEFAPLLRQGHGECNDPACPCHDGDPAACWTRNPLSL
jgi:hydrogenase maturation protease